MQEVNAQKSLSGHIRPGAQGQESPGCKKVYIKTFGCQMNVYDSERMADALSGSGYSSAEDVGDADLVILNTCHIREKASEKVYSELGRLKQAREERKRRARFRYRCRRLHRSSRRRRDGPARSCSWDHCWPAKLSPPALASRSACKKWENRRKTEFPAAEKFEALPAVKGGAALPPS